MDTGAELELELEEGDDIDNGDVLESERRATNASNHDYRNIQPPR